MSHRSLLERAAGETLIVGVKKGTHLGIQRFDLREVKHLEFYK
jgi:hypothetical protein